MNKTRKTKRGLCRPAGKLYIMNYVNPQGERRGAERASYDNLVYYRDLPAPQPPFFGGWGFRPPKPLASGAAKGARLWHGRLKFRRWLEGIKPLDWSGKSKFRAVGGGAVFGVGGGKCVKGQGRGLFTGKRKGW